MNPTLCEKPVVVVEHPDHKIREAPLCSRCLAKASILQPEGLHLCFTKGGRRRHYTEIL